MHTNNRTHQHETKAAFADVAFNMACASVCQGLHNGGLQPACMSYRRTWEEQVDNGHT